MPLTFWQDLKHRGLLPVKVLLFIQAAGDMAVYPFLTLHMKYLGITVTEIGIQFALTPVATLLATPLVGLLADKIGNFKLMLSISLVLVAGLSQLFLLVPPSSDHRNLPSLETNLSCSEHGSVFVDLPFNFVSPVMGHGFNLTERYQEFNVSLRHCTWVCEGTTTPSDVCFQESPDKRKCVNFNTVEKLLVNLQKDSSDEADKWTLGKHQNGGGLSQMTCGSGTTSCSGICKAHVEEILVVDPARHKLTFWTYLCLRILLYVIIATEMSLLKAACLTTIETYDSEYGFQRIWPNIASCITPLITGLMMDRLQNGEIEDYNPCFYIFGAMKLLMAIITLFVDLSPKTPTVDIWKNVIQLVKNPEVFFMLVYCTFVGSCWGYLETFLFWYLEGLGASKMLMGMTFTIGSAAGIIPSIFAGAIERKIGHVPIICIGLLAYAVRFVGYTFIPNAWYALIFEALECLTMSLMLITITTYANKLASAELVATMQAAWASLHFAVGRALGSLVGGFMIDSVGSVATYRIYAGKCVFMAVLYMIVYFCWLKKRIPHEGAHEESSQPEQMKRERFTSKEDIFEINGLNPDILKENAKNNVFLMASQEEKPPPNSEPVNRGEAEKDEKPRKPSEEEANNGGKQTITTSLEEGKDNVCFQDDEGQNLAETDELKDCAEECSDSKVCDTLKEGKEHSQ